MRWLSSGAVFDCNLPVHKYRVTPVVYETTISIIWLKGNSFAISERVALKSSIVPPKTKPNVRGDRASRVDARHTLQIRELLTAEVAP